ncbi:hypothetical protein JG688_00008183 [Phytophthora aleatoria]|uniref:Uncharacterized protein n=1 Tax=Phytophthora aleatoria TaxID=2496075 RepID=A0A8J5MG88_9STRA|nr:hypothetical protein JG688_00008183 [Phytophthora aleatoria]
MSETSDEDVNTMENGGAHREQCQEEEGVEYGNRSYATSDYYPVDGYVNEYGTRYGYGEPCDGEQDVGRFGTPLSRLLRRRRALLLATRMR